MHSAFDELAPTTFGLPERVVETVLSGSQSRRRRERLMPRLRMPLSLVAVFLLIAVVIGVLISSRLIQDWNNFHNPAPAGIGPQTELEKLEARPLNLPKLRADAVCPQSPGNSYGFDSGNGPVYVIGGQNIQTAWGDYWDVTYYTQPGLSGTVLVRGRELKTNRIVVFVGEYSGGRVVGTDELAGSRFDQRAELVFDAGSPHQRGSTGFGFFQVRQGLSRGWVGCFGFQIDGPNFTETITGS
jgi:hypothetical protein